MHTAPDGTLTRDRETGVGVHFEGNARGAAGSRISVMLRRLHVAFYLALAAAVCAPLNAVTPGTVSGVVRDSSGTPQIGAVVQLLRPNLSILASVYTDSKGKYTITGIDPGHYALKAMGAAFLPSVRENVRVRSNTVVNLTLNTLYEVIQWLPAQPRAGSAQRDDWAWTLRSAANRPLLRWLEDGPLVVVSDGSGAKPRLKARLVATGQEGTFGESGERLTASVETTPEGSRELLARVDFAPGTDAGMESMLGFRQDLGFAGAVQSVAAVAIHPEISGGGADGLDEAAIQSWEEINLGDALEAEVGAAQVMARLHQDEAATTIAALPFASVAWRKGESSIHYRMATAVPAAMVADESSARYWLPAVTVRNGAPALERGLHQEIGWQRVNERSAMEIVVYRDTLENPVLEAAAHGAGVQNLAAGDALLDHVSGIMRMAGPSFSTTGMQASLEHTIGSGNHMRLTYANGDALVMDAPVRGASLAQVVSKSHPRHVQMYALSLSGTLEGSETKWRASYRWQPTDTVTRVSPYMLDAAEPYLNLHLRQPLRAQRDGRTGIEALLDVNNLLAEGYQPYVLSDGSLLLFAQNQRAIRAGLAFTF
jgi:hypothetical protein